MPSPRAPAWAQRNAAERVEHKAARIAALHLLADRLSGIPKPELAAALGISRWTLDRDLAALPEVAAHVERMAAIVEEAERLQQEPPARLAVLLPAPAPLAGAFCCPAPAQPLPSPLHHRPPPLPRPRHLYAVAPDAQHAQQHVTRHGEHQDAQ